MVFDTTGVYVYADNTPRQLAAEGKLLVSQKSVKSPFPGFPVPPANFVCFPIFLKSIMSLVWLFRWMHMVFPFHLSFISVLLDCLIVIQERVLIWYSVTLFATVSDKRGLWIWMFIHSHVDFGLFILASTFTHNSYNGLCLYLVLVGVTSRRVASIEIVDGSKRIPLGRFALQNAYMNVKILRLILKT